VKVLLDTCAVIWATLSPNSLSPQARETIADEANTILVSAASAWEIATKVRAGKLPGAEKLEREYLEVMEEAGYTQLAIDTESALRAGRLVAEHRDPFDRMLIAQAELEKLFVVSNEKIFDQYGVRRVW